MSPHVERERRTALVTGGARGIGRAIVEGLAAAGHDVVVADLRTDESADVVASVTDAGGSAFVVQLDVTDPASVEAAVAASVERFGPVEILVNSAGWDELEAVPGHRRGVPPARGRHQLPRAAARDPRGAAGDG